MLLTIVQGIMAVADQILMFIRPLFYILQGVSFGGSAFITILQFIVGLI